MEQGHDDDFARLASLTARLASTANVDEICRAVLDEIVALGFAAAWIAVLDEQTGNLITVREVIDERDTTPEMPKIFMADTRQPIGVGFRERRMINIEDPGTLLVLEDQPGELAAGAMGLPRVIFEHLHGKPFACGPVLGSRGQPVGALGLSSYKGHQPIPGDVLEGGLLRSFRDHLGIAMERALHLQRLERLNSDLVRAQERILGDARMTAVGELASAVAHDLNNLSGLALMAVSIGYRSPEKAYEELPRIHRANRAIGDLVGRLQRVARSESSGDEVVNVSQLAEDLLLMLSPVCADLDVECVSKITPNLFVSGDRVALHQVIMNLLVNARDAFTESPSDRRRVLELELEGIRDQVRLSVRDTGPGIPADLLDRIFDPFMTTREGAHAGLGLATVHAAVKHFGGSITAENREGGGAEFTATFTRAQPPALATPPPPLERLDRRGPLRILTVDDDHDVVDLVNAFLEPLGCDTVGMTNALEALDLARTQAFDMVLCDVGMPGKNGLDLCTALRAEGVDSKLVLITGWDGARIRSDDRFASCDDILQKPFLGTDIVDVVTRLFPDVAR